MRVSDLLTFFHQLIQISETEMEIEVTSYKQSQLWLVLPGNIKIYEQKTF